MVRLVVGETAYYMELEKLLLMVPPGEQWEVLENGWRAGSIPAEGGAATHGHRQHKTKTLTCASRHQKGVVTRADIAAWPAMIRKIVRFLGACKSVESFDVDSHRLFV